MNDNNIIYSIPPNICCGIYLIKTHNGYFYGGKSVFLKRRFNEHVRSLSRNMHHNNRLQKIYNKYGSKGWTFNLVAESNPQYLIKDEQHWLDQNINTPMCLNVCHLSVTSSVKGLRWIHSGNTMRRIKDLAHLPQGFVLGRSVKSINQQKDTMSGRTLSDSHKLNISKSMTGERNAKFCTGKLINFYHAEHGNHVCSVDELRRKFPKLNLFASCLWLISSKKFESYKGWKVN